MEVIRIPGYTEEEKLNIAERYLMPKQLKANGLKEASWRSQECAVRDIVRYYTRESGVRNLEREIAKICRKVVKEIALAGPRGKEERRQSRQAAHAASPRRTSTSTSACGASISAAPKQRAKSAWSPVWPGPKSAATCCRSRPR